jgi:hypothetical protein
MAGWTLSSSRGDIYEFGHVVLEAGAGLRLHTKEGEDGPKDLYWGLDYEVWHNENEQVILRNAKGFLVDAYSIR